VTNGAAAGSTIRVVLVDDQELMRTAFRTIFDETDDIEVVGEALDGSGAVETVRRTRARRGPDGHPDARH
jgi:DNA-binding NarL/FixJ family response regulator